MSADNEAGTVIASAYVREMLDLNPIFQASQIMRRRRELWGVVAADATLLGHATAAAIESPQNPDADAKLRERAKQCLDVLQSKFYQLPAEKLNQYLGFLESKRLPEYAAIAARLRAAANCRETLIAAATETNDPKFAYSLQHSVVRPPAESGALKEQFIESIIDERRVVPAIKMVRKYVAAHPDVYALQRDWFKILLDPENHTAWAKKYSLRTRANQSSGLKVVVIGSFFVLVIAANFAQDPKKTSPKPGLPVAPSHVDSIRVAPNPTESTTRQLSSELAERDRLFQQPLDQAIQDFRSEHESRLPSNAQRRLEAMRASGPRFETVMPDPNQWHDEMLRESQRRHEEMMDRFKEQPSYSPPIFSPPNFPAPNFPAPNFPPRNAPRFMPGRDGFK